MTGWIDPVLRPMAEEWTREEAAHRMLELAGQVAIAAHAQRGLGITPVGQAAAESRHDLLREAAGWLQHMGDALRLARLVPAEALAELRQQHDARVAELLAANGVDVQRRRAAEAHAKELVATLMATVEGPGKVIVHPDRGVMPVMAETVFALLGELEVVRGHLAKVDGQGAEQVADWLRGRGYQVTGPAPAEVAA